VCSLNRSPTESSSQLIAEQVLLAMKDPRVIGDLVRVVDHEIKPCASVDMGSGDEWPAIRERVIEADILIVASPTWMGQPSNVCQRVLERLGAELSERDDEGRLLTYGKGAVAAIVGNEDGGHHLSAVVFRSSKTSATRSPRVASPTGTAKPCTERTTRTSTRHPNRWPQSRRPSQRTQPTWPASSSLSSMPRVADLVAPDRVVRSQITAGDHPGSTPPACAHPHESTRPTRSPTQRNWPCAAMNCGIR
jgi:multimeric flavodoxin WrbA